MNIIIGFIAIFKDGQRSHIRQRQTHQAIGFFAAFALFLVMQFGLNARGWTLLFFVFCLQAKADSFTNSLAEAGAAAKRGDVQHAAAIYSAAQEVQAGNATNLCVLAHRYCDLTYLTNSTAAQKDLVSRALACAQEAIVSNPNYAMAHASLAVCYAKSCNYCDIKTELAYSRLFKQEAEKALALDPKQDVAYNLLGRWNDGLVNLGFFARSNVKIDYCSLPQAILTDALNNYKKACEIAPSSILNHAGLAMAYEATGDKKLSWRN